MRVGEAREQLLGHECGDVTGRIVDGEPGQVPTGPSVRVLEMADRVARRRRQRVRAHHARRGRVRQHGVAAGDRLQNLLPGRHERVHQRLSLDSRMSRWATAVQCINLTPPISDGDHVAGAGGYRHRSPLPRRKAWAMSWARLVTLKWRYSEVTYWWAVA